MTKLIVIASESKGIGQCSAAILYALKIVPFPVATDAPILT
jgi:hypothetical protein